MKSHTFRGFHTRFRDISRGGIRIVKSTPDSYSKNRHNMFKEAYGLAYTQKLKNKDIAENGSKGIIGMYLGYEYMNLEAYKC
jgi:glutamate dehydrogenase